MMLALSGCSTYGSSWESPLHEKLYVSQNHYRNSDVQCFIDVDLVTKHQKDVICTRDRNLPEGAITNPSRLNQRVGMRTHTTGGSVGVKGYRRKDGTYVRPHTRRAPRRR